MRRCLDLASRAVSTSPNPLVGSVVVHGNCIIGEGFHKAAGQAHAEVEAVNAVLDYDRHLLPDSTLYVNLEPCSHYGKTPPCADMIVAQKIPRVVIGAVDSNPLVGGKGIKRLRDAGVEVTVGMLESECRNLNKRFFTFHELHRPYVILKWAQSEDGFIAPHPAQRMQLSNALSQTFVHKWRTEEDAVLVGFNTALVDDPQLTARLWPGKNPTRVVYDPQLKLEAGKKLFNAPGKVIVFNNVKEVTIDNLVYKKVSRSNWVIEAMQALHNENILSVMIEGGTKTLSAFIEANVWDEARVFVAPLKLKNGLVGPKLSATPNETLDVGDNQLNIYSRQR